MILKNTPYYSNPNQQLTPKNTEKTLFLNIFIILEKKPDLRVCVNTGFFLLNHIKRSCK